MSCAHINLSAYVLSVEPIANGHYLVRSISFPHQPSFHIAAVGGPSQDFRVIKRVKESAFSSEFGFLAECALLSEQCSSVNQN